MEKKQVNKIKMIKDELNKNIIIDMHILFNCLQRKQK